MDPLSLAIGIGGIAASIFGGAKNVQAQQQYTQEQQQMVGLEQQQNTVRQHAMEIAAGKQKMEIARSAQMARSQALSTATGQGAGQGSVLGGAYGGIAGQANVNQRDTNQNLQLGEQMFSIDNTIDSLKIQMASTQSQEATDNSIMGFGQTATKNAQPLSNLIQNFNPFKNFNLGIG